MTTSGSSLRNNSLLWTCCSALRCCHGRHASLQKVTPPEQWWQLGTCPAPLPQLPQVSSTHSLNFREGRSAQTHRSSKLGWLSEAEAKAAAGRRTGVDGHPSPSHLHYWLFSTDSDHSRQQAHRIGGDPPRSSCLPPAQTARCLWAEETLLPRGVAHQHHVPVLALLLLHWHTPMEEQTHMKIQPPYLKRLSVMHSQKIASTAKITEAESLFQAGFFGVGQVFFCPQHSGDPSHTGPLPTVPVCIKIGASTKLLSVQFQNTL